MIGEDEQLVGKVLTERVIVFFPEPPENVYELAQWYPTLRELHRRHPLVVITGDSRTTKAVRASAELPVYAVTRSTTFETMFSAENVGLALYVSHHSRNFAALRYPSMMHVFIGHGDSDKDVSVSNQLKAYDLTFVAGQAAADRLRRGLTLYDVDRRVVAVGRPQLDTHVDVQTPPAAHVPARVLYAPTWEGGQASVHYGSLSTHGTAIVQSLLGAGHPLVYRPHPRTGASSFRARQADIKMRALIAADPSQLGRVDTGTPLSDAIAEADVLITDVSSVAVEWLATGKPLLVTRHDNPALRIAASRLLDSVPRLDEVDAARAADRVAEALSDPAGPERRRALVAYYLGDVTPGASTKAFLDACTETLTLRDVERDRLRGLRSTAAEGT